MKANLPWLFFLASLIALGALAPTVPDEPLHLSGVFVVAGLLLAFVGVVTSIAVRWSQNDEAVRRQTFWAAIFNALTILVTLAVLFWRSMSQFA